MISSCFSTGQMIPSSGRALFYEAAGNYHVGVHGEYVQERHG